MPRVLLLCCFFGLSLHCKDGCFPLPCVCMYCSDIEGPTPSSTPAPTTAPVSDDNANASSLAAALGAELDQAALATPAVVAPAAHTKAVRSFGVGNVVKRAETDGEAKPRSDSVREQVRM